MKKTNQDKRKLQERLTFDQYGRYAISQNIIDSNRQKSQKFRILDVGGRGNLMKEFLPQDEVFYLDPYVETQDDNYIKGDGCNMPLDDNSFDWVISTDVFEHIPQERRQIFLQEKLRVAKLGVILVAPFYSKEVEEAEYNANEIYKALSSGKDHPWFKEHIKNGLPEEKNVTSTLKKAGYSFQVINNNRLFLWELLTGISFFATKNLLDDIQEELKFFNYFYNTNVFPYDSSTPAYRKIYFIKKDKNLKNITIPNKKIDDTLFLDTIKRSLDIISKIDSSNNSILNKVEEKFNIQMKEMERIKIIAEREKEDEVGILRGELFTIKTSKTWRLRNILARYNPVTLTKRTVSLIRRDGLWVSMEKVYYRIIYGRKFRGILEEKNYNKKFIKVHENWNEADVKKQIDTFKIKPKISVIVPVYDVDPYLLDQCINSVCSQYYENWELCLHDDLSTNKETKNCLKKWEQKKNPRIKISFGRENQHISGASNEAIKMVTGEYIALLDNDDELAPAALFEIVKLINNYPEADVIYSDEDKLDEQGKRARPFFKPSWSPEMLFSVNYINHLCVIRKSIGDEVGWFRKGYEGSQDYDLFLRIADITKNFFHVPFVLYHWREVDGSTAKDINNKKYCSAAGLKALDDYLLQNGYNAKAYMNEYSTNYEVRFELKDNPKVSIIIPFKDQVQLLKKCIETITDRSVYENYEIVLIDNNSGEKETADFLKSINDTKIKTFKYSNPFNYSKINNWGAKKASGDILLFLNNDTEVISPYWLEDMAGYAQRPEIGAVGAKLLFGNRTIQHAGVVVGIGGYADHIFSGKNENTGTFFGLDSWTRNYLAVTAACMMIERKKFEKIGGFDEEFVVCGSDVELCLRFYKKGYRNVYLPFVKLYHHESRTRKTWVDPIDITCSEKHYKEYLKNGDPYYNKNLSLLTRDGNTIRE